MGLMLHCGANRVDFATIADVPLPDETDSFHPIAHAEIVDRIRDELADHDLRVHEEAHGLWKEGARYFGLFDIRNGKPDDGWSMMIGVRNSHDKSIAAGIAFGSRVFVCDNLAFSGERVLARKHTAWMSFDLPLRIREVIGEVAPERERQGNRIEQLRGTEITDEQAHHVMMEAFNTSVIGAQVLRSTSAAWHVPPHEEFKPRTGWSLLNSFTEALKDSSMWQLPKRTQRLYNLIDTSLDLKAA